MILIGMEINAMAISPAPESAATPSAAASGFAQTLGVAQSGAPPGPEPPPTSQSVGEEVANLGPIALSLNPDFSPQTVSGAGGTPTPPVNPKADKPKTDPSQAVLLLSATLAASAFATPTVVLPQTPVAVNVAATANTAAQVSGIPNVAVVPTASTVTIDTKIFPEQAETSQQLNTDIPQQAKSIPLGPTSLQTPTLNPLTAPVATSGPSRHSEGLNVPTDKASSIKPLVDEMPARMIPVTDIAADAPANVTVSATSIAPIVATQVSGPVEVPGPRTGPITLKGGSKTSVTESVNPFSPAEGSAPDQVGIKIVAKAASNESEEPPSSTTKSPEGKPEPVLVLNGQTVTKEVAAPAQPLKSSDLNLVVRQIADRLELLAATQPKNGITVQLQPDSLGSITMTVKSLSGSVEAHISASNDNVRTALEQNRPMLNQAMSDRGLKLDSVSIAAQTQTSTSSQRQAGQQQQQEQAQHAQNHRQTFNERMATDSTTAHQARLTIRSLDGVDLWI